MHSPAHDDRCKDYVINAYVTWRGIFCRRLRPKLEIRLVSARARLEFSKLEFSRRVSAAPAVSALQTASVCLAAHKAVMPNGIDRITAKYVGKACVYMCREMRRPATTNRSGNGGKIRGSERAGDARGHSYRRATKRPACGAARCRVGALKASPDQAPGAVSIE
jgi:hypothetical protein